MTTVKRVFTVDCFIILIHILFGTIPDIVAIRTVALIISGTVWTGWSIIHRCILVASLINISCNVQSA